MAITLNTFVKLPKSQKIVILVCLLGVIVGLYIYSIYLPASQELEKKKVEMNKREMEVRELRTIAANMKRFQAEAAKLREELALAMAQLRRRSTP